MSNEDQNNRRVAPLGAPESKSPADRARLIREMQLAAETASAPKAKPIVAPSAPPPPAAPVSIGDGFKTTPVAKAAAVALAEKPVPSVHAEVGATQVSTDALFGMGKAPEFNIVGNPWKIIPFGDSLPAVLSPTRSLEHYTPVTSNQAMETKDGLLTQVGLKAKDGSEPLQKRAVVISAQGELKGAECKSAPELKQLLTRAPGFFERIFGFEAPKEGFTVRRSTQARFEVEVPAVGGAPKEVAFFNNFGFRVKASSNPSELDFKAHYNLDRFDSAL